MTPPKPDRRDVGPTESVASPGGTDPIGETAQPGGAIQRLRLEPGAVPVPDYQLVEFLGRGGCGEVWKAVGPGGHTAALKFIALGEHAGAAEERSAELLKAKDVRHPHLLGVLASWRRDDVLILAMPLADRPLTDRLNEACRQGLPGVPFDELMGYMREAAQGLDYLHSLGVQHRDVKPHNLLLVGGAVQVADFGLAKALQQMSASNTGAMTVAYAAPEFVKGRVSRHSDQYSLAVAYCQLRGGRLPFVGNAAQVMMGHLSGRPDLTMLEDEAERRVVAKALEKDPHRRWQSCREFVEALAQASPPVRRPWLPLALAGGLLLVAAAVIGVVVGWGQPPDKQPDAAETTTTGKAVGVDGNRLTFTADGKDRTVTVPDGAAVRIDGKDGTLDEIKKDGDVAVTSRGDVVSKVEVINPPPPRMPEVTVAGKFVGVDQDKLTVLVDEKEKTFTVPAAARVIIDDKDGRLKDIKMDSALTITGRADVASKVEVKSPAPPPPPQERQAAGKATRAEKNKLTIQDDAGKELTITVPGDAKVTVDGKAGAVEDIKADSAVTVTLKGDVASKVEAKSPAPPPPKLTVAAGKVVGVDKDRLTVRADDGEKTFTVPADARVTIDDKDGQLADIRKNSTVSVTRKGDVVVTVEAKSPPPPAAAKAPFNAAEAKRVQQEWADYLGVPLEQEADLGGGVTMKLRLIPAGRFTMGSPKDEDGRHDNEGPQHDVELTRPFHLGVSPVTKGQFAAFVKDEGYRTEAEKAGGPTTWRNPGFPQTDDDPVVDVTWKDAGKFCEWLSKKEKKSYELPTEAEWEYACRAGTTTAFFFGHDPKDLGDFAWFGEPLVGGHTHPVGTKKPNPWGLYDMGGNVWQWCADRYGPYQERSIKDPKGEDSGEQRVLRGGSWYTNPGKCRSAGRYNDAPGYRGSDGGFRVVLRTAPTTP